MIEPVEGAPYARGALMTRINFVPAPRDATPVATVDLDARTTLADVACSIAGGSLRLLELIRLAADQHDADAETFMEAFLAMRAADPKGITLDRVCAAAQLSASTILQAIVTCADAHATAVGNLVAAVSHPAIVGAAVQSAQRLDSTIGQRDRHALLTHARFLPVPKGATIHVQATANAAAAAAASSDVSVPSFLDDVNHAVGARDLVQQEVVDAIVVPADDAEDAEDA